MPAETITPPPASTPPFAIPPGINVEAWEKFDQMVQDCGKTIFRMPTSCEIYLKQYLRSYPEERRLISEALKLGIPDQILQTAGDGDYANFLTESAHRVAEAAGVDEGYGRWAVDAWATALNRPVGYKAPKVELRPKVPEKEKPAVSDTTLRRIMACIAGFGGFMGGAVGNGGAVLVLLVTDVAVDNKFYGKEVGNHEIAGILVLLFLMFMGGVFSGLGAFAGWLFGRGDQRPWAGASAAFGSAFGTACVCFFVTGPGLSCAIAMTISSFGASFGMAARGGYKPS